MLVWTFEKYFNALKILTASACSDKSHKLSSSFLSMHSSINGDGLKRTGELSESRVKYKNYLSFKREKPELRVKQKVDLIFKLSQLKFKSKIIKYSSLVR